MHLVNCENGVSYEVSGPFYENNTSKIWCGITESEAHQKFVVKILKYGEVQNQNVAKDLLEVSKQEANTLKKVAECTKYVPKLKDSWQDKKNRMYVIIMDRVPGQSLREWMESHRKDMLSSKDIFVRKCIVVQICEIMRDINRKYPAIVHRDLKPENIYINFNRKTNKWDVYVIDFGCANLNHIRNVGTNNYQAPEQTGIKNTGIAINNKTDIFAIGQIFYELLLGEVPKIGEDYLYKLREDQWIKAPGLSGYISEMPGADKMELTMKQMTCFKQEDRLGYDRIISCLKNNRVG